MMWVSNLCPEDLEKGRSDAIQSRRGLGQRARDPNSIQGNAGEQHRRANNTAMSNFRSSLA